MNHNYSIDFEDIYLCPMTFDDAESYRVIRNMDSIRCWFGSQTNISSDAQKQWFAKYLNDATELMFSIYSTKHVFLGGCSLYHIQNQAIGGSSCEFGRLLLHPRYQGYGYGRKAVCAAIQIGMELGITYFYLKVYKDNIAAIRSYLSAGFAFQDKDNSIDGNKFVAMELLLTIQSKEKYNGNSIVPS